MSIHDTLLSASRFADSRWRAARAAGREEEKRLWSYVKECRAYIGETGQVYLFEDYLKGIAPSARPHMSTTIEARQDETWRRVMELLLRAFDEASEPEQKQSAFVLVQLINFVADTEQSEAVGDYVHNRLEYAPLAIAHFTTRQEAEAWLKGLSEPPSPARILIGDAYFLVWSSREDNARGMSRDYVLEPYMEALVVRGIPPTTPSFQTRMEAGEWLKNHPAAPFVFVAIAGEHYLAVHHKGLKRHSLHPVATALTEWEEKKRAAEREMAQDVATEDEAEDA